MMTKQKSFQDLFHKFAISGFSLESVSEVKAFQASCSDDPLDFEFVVKSDALISTIYFNNDVFEASLAIDLLLLPRLPTNNPDYSNILLRSTKTSVHLKRADEISPFVLIFLEKGEKKFSSSIPLMHWYLTNNGLNDDYNRNIVASAVADAASEIGLDISPGTTLKDQVILLNSELERAFKDLHILHTVIQNKDEQEQEYLINYYVENEPLRFFQNIIVNQYLSS